MTLWPGYWAHGIDKCLEPILREIPKVNLYSDLGEGQEVTTLFGKARYFPETSIRAANGYVGFEDFLPGGKMRFHMNQDVVMLVVSGESEVTYSLYGSGLTEWKKMKISKGDIYVAPNGAVIDWLVTSSVPLRQMLIIMPGS